MLDSAPGHGTLDRGSVHDDLVVLDAAVSLGVAVLSAQQSVALLGSFLNQRER